MLFMSAVGVWEEFHRKYIYEFLILLRSLYIGLAWGLMTIFMSLCIRLGAVFFDSKHLHPLLVLWARSLLAVAGIKVRVENADKLCTDQACTIAANHSSLLDILVFYVSIKKDFAWVAKDSLFRAPFVGSVMRSMEYIAVKRDNEKHALRALLQAAAMMQKQQRAVVIFPEGTRGNPDGSLRPFKKGALILALRSKSALQPVSIRNSGRLQPYQEHRLIPRIFPGTVYVKIQPYITGEEVAKSDIDALNARLRASIESGLKASEDPGCHQHS